MLETAQSPGYKLMVEEWERLRAQTLDNAPYTCATIEQWSRCRGELATFDYVLSTEKLIDSALVSLLASTDDEDERPTNSLED